MTALVAFLASLALVEFVLLVWLVRDRDWWIEAHDELANELHEAESARGRALEMATEATEQSEWFARRATQMQRSERN